MLIFSSLSGFVVLRPLVHLESQVLMRLSWHLHDLVLYALVLWWILPQSGETWETPKYLCAPEDIMYHVTELR